jgi:endonuclease/exonuclease/phosphatase family metal-dependent hydrolase
MPHKRSLLFFAALTLLSATFLTLLYANRNVRRPPPPSAVWSPPDHPVKFVSYNILHNRRGIARVIDEIGKLDPDFVLLQEVDRSDVTQMSQALGRFPAIYHASENLAGPHASWGNAILSRHPLYDASSIPNPGGGSFGVWATAVVDNKKFLLGNVHLSATWNANPAHLVESSNNRWKELTNLVQAWQSAGSPPIVIGGDFNQLALGNNYALMTQHWSDALKTLGKDQPTFTAGLLNTRIDYFLISREWNPLTAEVVDSDASDHKPIRLQAGKHQPPSPSTPAG